MLRVVPQLSPLCLYLPLLRAFQWGTVWPCTHSRESLILHNDHANWHASSFGLLCWQSGSGSTTEKLTVTWLTTQLYMQIQVGCMKTRLWQTLTNRLCLYLEEYENTNSCGSTLNICQGILKRANLLHKRGFVKTEYSILPELPCNLGSYRDFLSTLLCISQQIASDTINIIIFPCTSVYLLGLVWD